MSYVALVIHYIDNWLVSQAINQLDNQLGADDSGLRSLRRMECLPLEHWCYSCACVIQHNDEAFRQDSKIPNTGGPATHWSVVSHKKWKKSVN
jgi:hypothetical protein